MRHALPLPLLLSLAPGALAQTLDYTVDPAASALELDVSVELDLAGDLRGVYDAATNPGGTRTLRGFIGDDGTNQMVPLGLTVALGLDVDGPLAGAFQLTLDGAVATVEGLALDLGGGPDSVDLDLVLFFDLFRTLNPGSVYPGGIPIPIPLGSVDVTAVRLEQTAPGVGVAMPGAVAGTFDVTAAVPVALSFEVSGGLLGGGGGVTPVGPVPLVLPLAVTVDRGDCGSALAGGAADALSSSFPSPFPLDLEDLPLDLPTVFPAGNTANLLVNASLDTITVGGSFDVQLGASAAGGRVEEVCAGNANSTGAGAALATAGIPSVASADLGLVASGLPADAFGMLVMSQVEGFVPGFGGSQGDLCIGEPCYRFVNDVANSGLAGEMTIFPDFAQLPMGQVFAENETWIFQLWYRDANPGATSNTTGAIAVTFCR